MKLLSNILALVFVAFFSPRTLCSEEINSAYSRSSYTISYQNSDSIAIKCKKDHSCSITVHVNGHSYKFSPEEIDVNRIDPIFATLRTPLGNFKNRHYSFEFTISTNCPSGISEKDFICFTSVKTLEGKVEDAYSFLSNMETDLPI